MAISIMQEVDVRLTFLCNDVTLADGVGLGDVRDARKSPQRGHSVQYNIRYGAVALSFIQILVVTALTACCRRYMT